MLTIAIDPVEGDELLNLLDGLPLAISQAAALLQERGVKASIYIKYYKEK
jgi:tetratricopeptide (TPR) repeat protein